MHERGDGEVRPRAGRRLPFAVVAVLGLVLLAAVVAWLAWDGRLALRRVKARAEAVGIAVRHVKEPTNASALALDALLVTARFDPTPRRLVAASRGAQTEADRVRPYLDAFLEARWRDRAALPSAELATWLTERAASLDDVERLLVGDQGPRWEVDTARGHEAPVPNLTQQTMLHDALLARALLADDAAAADQSLRAGWALLEASLSRPELIWHLVSLRGHRRTMRAVRECDVPAAPWIARIDALDLATLTRDAIDFDITEGLHVADRGGAAQRRQLARWIDDLVTTREALVASGPCDDSREVAERAWPDWDETAVPSENWPISGRDVGRIVTRSRLVQLETELTRRVLRVRELRETGSLRDVMDFHAIGASRFECPLIQFTDEILTDGRARVSMSKDPSWRVGDLDPAMWLTWEEAIPGT